MILARKRHRENIRTFVCYGYERKSAIVRQRDGKCARQSCHSRPEPEFLIYPPLRIKDNQLFWHTDLKDTNLVLLG